MKILVTGAAGSIGSELVKQLVDKNELFLLDNNETGLYDMVEELKEFEGHKVQGIVGDIRNKETIENVFSSFKPQIVYHAAAYKHVTPMEWTPMEAVSVNIEGTYNLVQASKKYKVKKFIFISTDKVVNAQCVMGATKKVAEIIVRNAGYIAVRFGNVVGSRGSVLPIWQKQILQGKPITVTDPEMERYFMTIQEAVSLVIKAGEIGKGGEVIILDMGKPLKIIELANALIKQSRLDIPIKIIGKRSGEQLKEKLMTDEEQQTAIKKDNFYILK